MSVRTPRRRSCRSSVKILPPPPLPLPPAVDVDARLLDAPVVAEAPGGLRPGLGGVAALLHQPVDELVDVKRELPSTSARTSVPQNRR